MFSQEPQCFYLFLGPNENHFLFPKAQQDKKRDILNVKLAACFWDRILEKTHEYLIKKQDSLE